VATAKKMYTYYDADKVEDGAVPKSACKLPHHFVSDDGSPGAASVAGVRNALARLPQTQGLSDAERTAAEAHLKKHLNAFSGGEDVVDDDVDDAAADPAEPDDAKKPLPPFLKPGREEEEEEEEETEDAVDDDDDDPPPETPTDTHDEADDWKQLIGFLVSPTSSSADDVLAHLKEEW
jgi:hypothetical protein